MRIENEFVVKAPIERVWAHLLDVQRVASCMPGAELTEVVDDRTSKGQVNVKLGPVSLSFTGTVVIQERDDVAHVVALKAEGREQRGKGAASAMAVSRLETVEGGTRVVLETELTISGAVAQYGRGMLQDISHKLTTDFANCLQASIDAHESVPVQQEPAEPPVAAPVGGLGLGLWATWRAILRFFGRLFGRRS